MSYTELLAVWTGVSGLPGYSKFRFAGALTGAQINSAAANIRTFWEAIKAVIPSSVTIAVQPGASIHEDNGELVSEQTVTVVPATVVGTGSSLYSAASGAMVLWQTGAINGGKKIRGRTYLVPLSTLAFQNDGTLADANRSTIIAAASAFASSTPAPAVNSRARPNNPAAANATVQIISATVPDKQVVLRSRRD